MSCGHRTAAEGGGATAASGAGVAASGAGAATQQQQQQVAAGAAQRRGPPPAGRAPKYEEQCFGCGAKVPQLAPAAVCDFPRCVRVKCMRCHPNMDQVLACPQHTGRVVQLRTATGAATLAAAVDPLQPPSTGSAVADTWYQGVAVVLATAPAAAADGMERAFRFFSTWVRYLGLTMATVTAWTVMSYVLARCAPIVGATVPPFMATRVAPQTVAGDITLLRRRARLMGDEGFLRILTDELVMRIVSLVSANTSKKKSEKRPILMRTLREMWNRIKAKCTLGVLRNAALLVLGLVAGMRRRELVALVWGDVQWHDNKEEMIIAVRRDKRNTNIIGAQTPRRVAVAHPLLTEVWRRYRDAMAGHTGGQQPLFPVLVGTTVTTRSLEPGTVNTIVREMLPGLRATPHGLRVGFATELYAAGVHVSVIMEVGRWSSLCALHYVLPSTDSMTRATRAMGDGVAVDRVVLQREVGADVVPPRIRRVPL